MIKKDLVIALQDYNDEQEVNISIDISTCDADSGNRAFGTPIDVQDNGSGLTILCEGLLDY